jgi:hypothetical protein
VIRKQRADGIARPKHIASQNSKKVSWKTIKYLSYLQWVYLDRNM